MITPQTTTASPQPSTRPSTTSHPHPFTRPARPHPVTRPATGIQTTLLEVVSFFVGGCAQNRGRGRGGRGLGVYRHLPQTSHKKGGRWREWEMGGKEGVLGRARGLQASDAREAFQARPQVSCFQGSGFGFQGLAFRTGLGLSFRV